MVMPAHKTVARKLAQTVRVSSTADQNGSGEAGEGSSTSRSTGGGTRTGELKEIETVTTYICNVCTRPNVSKNACLTGLFFLFYKDTNQILMPQDIKHVFQYGGENVIFSKEEMKELQNFGDAQLLLQGFKHRSILKPYHNVTHSHFIYPDEQVKAETACQIVRCRTLMWVAYIFSNTKAARGRSRRCSAPPSEKT